MKVVQMIILAFATSYSAGKFELSKSLKDADIERESSIQPTQILQTSVAQDAEAHGLKGQMPSNERKVSQVQKNLFSNRETILRLFLGFQSMKQSRNVLENNEFLKVQSSGIPRIDKVKHRTSRLAQAQKSNHATLLEDYPKITRDFIKMSRKILSELESVDQEVAFITQAYLKKLSGSKSGVVFSKPATSSLISRRPMLLPSLPSMRFMEPILDSSKKSGLSDGFLSQDNIDMINQIRVNNVPPELNRILHKLKLLSMNARLSTKDLEPKLETEVVFETHIFQTLRFLYENQLCDQQVLKAFFSTENTLERTYKHLRNLFDRRRQPSQALYFTLMPEMSFVLNDWNTAHLHSLLKELEQTQQVQLVELLLIGAIAEYKKDNRFHPAIETIMNPVIQDRILKHWYLDGQPDLSTKQKVEVWFQELVRFFGNAHHSITRLEYLISYYLLNFVKMYQSSHFPALSLSKSNDDFFLHKKFELFQAGIRLHEAINRSLDYEYLSRLPWDQKEYLTTEITDELIRSATLETQRKAYEYKFILEHLKTIEDDELLGWIQENTLIEFYETLLRPKERRNLWSFNELPFKLITTKKYLLPSYS
ncbi:hypothetical protein O181_003788 [Austropuccinia psidii MF-1]|uniref:Uncharacterized protein n=1 Tax=Austropuccinia psidii MF-1 TaxID=1389203 RepID=A0A9Q3BF30_9BASI|nr:hypothetical protein [Austropuccinia psidii MF-1]